MAQTGTISQFFPQKALRRSLESLLMSEWGRGAAEEEAEVTAHLRSSPIAAAASAAVE